MNPIPPEISAILFDLDGTLLDAYAAQLTAYNVMFAHFGIVCDEELFISTYNPNFYETYKRFNIPVERWDEASDVWLAAAAQSEVQPFPGVVDAIRRLAARYPLGVVTAGNRARVMGDLARTGLQPFFKVIITHEEVQQMKPHPEGLLLALKMLKVTPEQAIYVGDALPDQQMAAAAGVRFIGVPSKFRSLTPGMGVEMVESVTMLG